MCVCVYCIQEHARHVSYKCTCIKILTIIIVSIIIVTTTTTTVIIRADTIGCPGICKMFSYLNIHIKTCCSKKE